MSDCTECGMWVDPKKPYHPYAACLMYKGCRDSEAVQANLDVVVADKIAALTAERDGALIALKLQQQAQAFEIGCAVAAAKALLRRANARLKDDAACEPPELSFEIDAFLAPPPSSEAGTSKEMNMNEDQIKHMVTRFLGWRLPEHFNPDGGISFKREYNEAFNAARGKPPAIHQPYGTNVFDAQQAEAMVRHMLEGLPASPSSEAGT